MRLARRPGSAVGVSTALDPLAVLRGEAEAASQLIGDRKEGKEGKGKGGEGGCPLQCWK